MTLRLISNPSGEADRRLIRIMHDTLKLAELTRAEIRARYETIEAIRDRLSIILDRVDGKR